MNACTEYRETLNAALDDGTTESLDSHPHPATCADCRAETTAAMTMIRAFARSVGPAVPAGFSKRVVQAAVRDRLMRRTRRVAGLSLVGLAAAVLVAVFTNRTPTREPEVAKAPLGPQLRDAGTALVALTKRTTDETFAPAKTLFVAPSVSLASSAPPAVAEPLSAVPDAARTSVEPITGTARRALNLFVRDIGGAAGLGKGDS